MGRPEPTGSVRPHPRSPSPQPCAAWRERPRLSCRVPAFRCVLGRVRRSGAGAAKLPPIAGVPALDQVPPVAAPRGGLGPLLQRSCRACGFALAAAVGIAFPLPDLSLAAPCGRRWRPRSRSTEGGRGHHRHGNADGLLQYPLRGGRGIFTHRAEREPSLSGRGRGCLTLPRYRTERPRRRPARNAAASESVSPPASIVSDRNLVSVLAMISR